MAYVIHNGKPIRSYFNGNVTELNKKGETHQITEAWKFSSFKNACQRAVALGGYFVERYQD